MKVGILINEGEAPVKNIGDYIQSLVQAKFWRRSDCYIERERLNEFHSDEKMKVIMNGWFMRNPNNFPPSNDIDPLFISFHITPRIEPEFFSKKTIEYLRKHEPIGCRDYGTVSMMKSYGIKAYFSGCLTLCLGEFYNLPKTEKIYFVDPYYEYASGARGWYKHFKAIYLAIKHHKIISKFIKNFSPEFYGFFQKISPNLNKWTMAASFYETYRSFFGDEIFEKAEFINHQISQHEYNTNHAKMELAHQLMQKYSSAGMVITSRIHCALPCLGVQTPLFFVSSENIEDGRLRSGGRLGGLINLFNILKWTPKGVLPITKNCVKLSYINSVSDAKSIGNPKDYLYLKKKMMEKINKFIS